MKFVAQPPTVNQFTPSDLAYLHERAIDVELALQLGIRRVSAEEAAALLGRNDSPPSGGLAFPYPPDFTYARIRMDAGAVRYMCPARIPVPVYVPFGHDDPAQPLVVVESPAKALSLMSAGWFSVGLGGVSTTLVKDEARLNDSWAALSLAQRAVVVLFDANRVQNIGVAAAEARLALALERAGARVTIAALPPSTDGALWGPDDFHAQHGASALHDILKSARPADPVELVRRVASESDREGRLRGLLNELPFVISVLERGEACAAQCADLFGKGFKRAFQSALKSAKKSIEDSRRSARREALEGHTFDSGGCPVANFTARVVEELIFDDGRETTIEFRIAGQLAGGEPLPELLITPKEFMDRPWPAERWGARAIVEPHPQAIRELRVAIQRAHTPLRRRVFRHLGWRNVDGSLAYLFHGGAVGANCEVELEGRLRQFSLPARGEGDVAAAVRASVALLNVGPKHIAGPLLAAVYRAPTLHFMPCDALLHLFGTTDNLKSSTAAVFASHFGSFTHDTLPASFRSTAYSIEAIAAIAGDVMLVVDEYVPASADLNDPIRKAMAGLVRLIGNSSPRNRLTVDGKLRVPPLPRALVVTTGEERPSGESAVARALCIPFTRGDIDAKKLQVAQNEASLLPVVMRAYIEWLRERAPLLSEKLSADFARIRSRINSGGAHRRALSTAAHLLIGAELFAEFAIDVGALSEDDAEIVSVRLESGILKALDLQVGTGLESDPGRVFLDQLNELLIRRDLRLGSPAEPASGAEFVGWSGANEVWLIPGLAYGAVAEFMRRQGGRMSITEDALWRRLRDSGSLIADKGRLKTKRVIAGQRLRVVVLPRAALDCLAPAPPLPGQAGQP